MVLGSSRGALIFTVYAVQHGIKYARRSNDVFILRARTVPHVPHTLVDPPTYFYGGEESKAEDRSASVHASVEEEE